VAAPAGSEQQLLLLPAHLFAASPLRSAQAQTSVDHDACNAHARLHAHCQNMALPPTEALDVSISVTQTGQRALKFGQSILQKYSNQGEFPADHSSMRLYTADASFLLSRSQRPASHQGRGFVTWAYRAGGGLTCREVRAGGGGTLSGGAGTAIGEDGRGGNDVVALEGVVGVGALGSALPCAAAAPRPASVYGLIATRGTSRQKRLM